MNFKGFFITGTDTGIGKTVVTAALTSILSQAGRKVLPVKPIQTGCSAAGLAPDTAQHLKLSHIAATPNKLLPLLTTYRFKEACSPHLAARLAGTAIRIARVMEDLQNLQKQTDILLIEGAGGVLVPLNEQETMLDLMLKINLPVILVSHPYLGTINHTLLSLKVMQAHKLKIAGIFFNSGRPTENSDLEADNCSYIAQKTQIPLIGHLPYVADLDTITPSLFARQAQDSLLLTPNQILDILKAKNS